MRIGSLAVLAVVGLVAGCGAGDAAGSSSQAEPASTVSAGATACGACNHPAGYCLAHVGAPGMEPAECTQLGGTPVAACPTADLVGVCRTVIATPEPWDRYYYATCSTSPQDACASDHGAWRATP